MILDKRIPPKTPVNQSQKRRQHRQEIGKGKKPGPEPRPALEPQNKHGGHHRQQRQIRNPPPGLDLPTRINQVQRMRPEKFAQIKPDRVTHRCHTLRPSQPPLRISGHRHLRWMRPHGHSRRGDRHQTDGGQSHQMTPLPPALHPPGAQAQHHRQHHRRRLARHRQGRAKQSPPVVPPLPALVIKVSGF